MIIPPSVVSKYFPDKEKDFSLYNTSSIPDSIFWYSQVFDVIVYLKNPVSIKGKYLHSLIVHKNASISIFKDRMIIDGIEILKKNIIDLNLMYKDVIFDYNLISKKLCHLITQNQIFVHSDIVPLDTIDKEAVKKVYGNFSSYYYTTNYRAKYITFKDNAIYCLITVTKDGIYIVCNRNEKIPVDKIDLKIITYEIHKGRNCYVFK